MNTQIIRNVSLALLAAATMFAQEPSTLKVNVPFGFHVGNTMLPAGEYRVDSQIGRNLLRVSSADATQAVVILTTGAGLVTKSTKARLTFNRYGKQYFLAQVWAPNAYDGRELVKAKLERQEAKKADPEVESVVAAK